MVLDRIVLAALLLLASSAAEPTGSDSSCRCMTSHSPGAGLRVNCSSRGLRTIPCFSPDTTELDLRHNGLSSIPAGHFDMVTNLRLVNLADNPFHCGCAIRYLRSWLWRNRGLLTSDPPRCASPAHVSGTPVSDLDDTHFSDCSPKPCGVRTAYDAALGVALCLVAALLFCCFRLAKNLTFILGIGERHGGLQAEMLRSLKPKHRLHRKSLGGASLNQRNDQLERPLLNMEILPQIIDALHKQHNIKLKEM